MKAEIRKLSDRYHLELIAETDLEEVLLNGFEKAIEEGFIPSSKHDLGLYLACTRPIRLMGGSSRSDNIHTKTVSMQTMNADLTENYLELNKLRNESQKPWYKKIFGGNR